MRTSIFLSTLSIVGLAGLGGCTDDLEVIPVYNPATGRVEVHMNRELDGGESLFVQTRRGSYGTLNCGALSTKVKAIDASEGSRYFGPAIDQSLLKPFYGPEWAYEPTPEMLASLAAGTDSIVDVCLMNGSEVVAKVEGDLFAAIDAGRAAGLGGKADDAESGEQSIQSAQKYGERCVAELGEIPFFEKQGEWDYKTYNCLDSTPIPMTVTSATGTVTRPDGEVATCDKPQYIYSLCEQGPRVASRINTEGTRWVLLCRKSIGGLASSEFNDIAMIGNNPFTGKTCYFQNALYQKRDGAKVPHPADKTRSTNLWAGVQGGIGSGIQCTRCHDADVFIHSPWIDGAKDAAGRTIVPKMGEDDDYVIGANDVPYKLVNRAGQGWAKQNHITDARASACTKCHRMGAGYEWSKWVSRIDQTDAAWETKVTEVYKSFEKSHWMPLDLTGLTADNWADSEYGQALSFIKTCRTGDAGCQQAEIPQTVGGGGGGGKLRNPVNLSATELATQSLAIIEVGGCRECHAITKATLRDWHELTETAENGPLANADNGGTPTTANENKRVDSGDFAELGPYQVASGGTFKVTMSGTGQADLYVKRGSAPTTASYDCRPFAEGSNEACNDGTGPGAFYIGIKGGNVTSQVRLAIAYTKANANAPSPADVVKGFRLDPSNVASPFVPQKLGIYAGAAHLGYLNDLFKAAYPADQFGTDGWVVEYGKFKARVSMPKGNHPRWTQEQLDIVAEWFARDLPELANVLQEDPAPTTCEDFVSPEMTNHIATMATQGWKQQNQDNGINMFGCTGSDTGACLGSFPRASAKTYGTNWESALPGSKLRVLRELAFSTFYWMRSSPDGRFVMNGDSSGGVGAMTSDLQRDLDIPTTAAYDPGFFPGKDSGWIFQNTPIGTAFCTMSLLTSNPTAIDFSAAQCSSVQGVGLYQHLGQGLNGSDYFTINSQFTSDNGGTGETLEDPTAGFAGDAEMKLTPMAFTGGHYESRTAVTVPSPFLGDSVLSPSSQLAISRMAGPNGTQLGYEVHKLSMSGSGNNVEVTAEPVARYCSKGAKPSVSFDERFAVTHHYEGNGTSNIYVLDLQIGTYTKVTNMANGQYALFPHFRSDGWFYFLVRDTNSGKEYAVASDAAVTLAN